MSTTASPFEAYVRVADLQRRNPTIFRSRSAAYFFLEKHASVLLEVGALVRLGRSKRAPVLVNERLLLEQCRRWAAEL